MNNLKVFKNEMFEVAIQMENGEVLFDAENVAKSLGLTEIKNKKEYVMWRRVNLYLKPFGTTAEDNSPQVAKGDFIPESLVYKLAFKANNEVAEKFQDWLAMEVLPQIRKHGMYAKDELLDNPDLLLDVVKKYKEEREEKILLQNQLEKDKPKVIFAEALETSNTSILVGELAKLLARNGVEGIGQNRLFKWLRKNGYLHKRGEQYNLPTQLSIELAVMETKTRTINNPDGSVRLTKTSKITGKGQIYFVNKFKEKEIA